MSSPCDPCGNFAPATPPYTDLQRARLRQFMGYTKLFASSNAVFEDVLNVIQSSLDDGSTFNETIWLMNEIECIDQQIKNNSYLGLGTEIEAKIKFDAYRNDRFLRMLGRNYIKKLSIIFAMKPAQDYYGRATTDTSGNIYPTSYDFGNT
jgi:hypothetical protein